MIKIIQQPAIEPVTRAEAKLHSRIDLDADDSIVDVLIQVAREYCEMFQGRAYVEQTIEYILDRWPRHRMIFLPRPPVQSVTHVRYRDIDGTEHDFDDWIADTDSEPAIVHLEPGASWPSGSLWPSAPIRVRYIAGYEPTDNPLPEYVRAAIKLLVGNYYENREGVLPAGHVGKELPMGVQALLWQDRVFWTGEFNK